MPCGATQDGQVMMERSDRMWSTAEGNGKPLQYSCLENSMENSGRLQSMGSEVRGSGQEELLHVQGQEGWP